MDPAVPPSELARAARILTVRSRRASSSLFTGGYTSAFRGGGMEFEESRPYVPGDDVRHLDWNATARTGQPFVKRFREERDQTLLLILDASASMDFGTCGRTKAELAAHAAALLATAAGHAGDRVGLLAFSGGHSVELAPRRGPAHTWSVVRAAVEVASRAGGAATSSEALARVRGLTKHRSIVVVLSDFRDVSDARRPRSEFLATTRQHDVVAAVVGDRHEEELPNAGPVRLDDPETPGRELVIDSGSTRVRTLYATAARVRRQALERRLRADGADLVWLRTDRDPLSALLRFFEIHAGRAHHAQRGAA